MIIPSTFHEIKFSSAHDLFQPVKDEMNGSSDKTDEQLAAREFHIKTHEPFFDSLVLNQNAKLSFNINFY